MRKVYVFIALIVAFAMPLEAQWVSPGTGNDYTFTELVSAADGAVIAEDAGTFRMVADITISANDGLTIAPDEMTIFMADQVTLTIQGSFNCRAHDTYVEMKTENSGHYNLRFENAIECNLTGIKFKYGGGFQVIESDVVFEDCYFVHANSQVTNAAVNFMNCNPTFKNCTFKNNDGAAISSPVNGNGSPTIIGCYFYNNDITNANVPQINLGPGAEATIRIEDCIVEGNGHEMSGGISIADLVGTGNTTVLLKGNVIKNNRYGYNQQGYNINAVIEDNQIIDNNLEPDPMNGGSGISIYGMNTNNIAKLRRNVISGNLWGITTIYYNDVDLGTEEDPGCNAIFGNHNDAYGADAEYAIYVNAFSDIPAIGNYWGGNDEDFAESVIYHRPDLGDTYGVVTYSPIAELHPDILNLAVTAEANPQLSQDYFGEIDAENHIVNVFIPEAELTSMWLYTEIELPLGASSDFVPGEVINLAEPVAVIVETPHGETQEWTIILSSDWNVEEATAEAAKIYSNANCQIIVELSCENAEAEVFNVLGQKVGSASLNQGQNIIETSGWRNGIYTIVVVQGENAEVGKVIVR